MNKEKTQAGTTERNSLVELCPTAEYPNGTLLPAQGFFALRLTWMSGGVMVVNEAPLNVCKQGKKQQGTTDRNSQVEGLIQAKIPNANSEQSRALVSNGWPITT